MRIKLNGEPYDLVEPLTVSALLAKLGIDGRRVAVEHNLVVLKRAAFDKTTVEEGDEVEIVNFVGGGSPRRFCQDRGSGIRACKGGNAGPRRSCP